MMSRSRRLGATLLSLLVSACTTTGDLAAVDPGRTLGHYVFDYSITDRSTVHVVQVFDDGTKTFVQFSGFRDLKPTFRLDPLSPEIAFERNGPYAVLAGTYPSFVIMVGRASANVVANRTPPASKPVVPPTRPASEPGTLKEKA